MPRYTLQLIRLAQGDYPGFLDEYAAFGDRLGLPHPRLAAEAGRAALATGAARAMAAAMAEVLRAAEQRGAAPAFEVARFHAIAGNTAEALSWLQTSRNRHEAPLIALATDPAFAGLRADPGFGELLAAIGLKGDGPGNE